MNQINRRTFMSGLFLTALSFPRSLWAMGKEDRYGFAQLEYAGNWNPRPTAARRMLLEVEKRTSISVNPEPVVVTGADADLFEHPFLIWSGDRKFAPLSDKVIENLRQYLRYGGFIFVDSAEGISEGPFLASVKRELSRILPKKSLSRIPKDHVLFKSFYLIPKPVGRLAIQDHALGIWDEDRLSIVVSSNDIQGAWARDMFGTFTYECSPGGEQQREMAYRMGINLAMYSLCINYKADQVHVPFILKRRKWKVE